jgi:hypothetical protein
VAQRFIVSYVKEALLAFMLCAEDAMPNGFFSAVRIKRKK